MKLTSLLAQYLYIKHRLDLPGIGSFVLDPSAMPTLESSKQRSTVLDSVSFESNATMKDPADLISFISSQSGKMKALATADLDSFIQLALQFLNMGKPFTFEGIGTLVKKRAGEFEFVPLSVSTEKLKEYQTRETRTVSLEQSSAKYESFLGNQRTKLEWGKPVIVLLVLAGIALAIWGGYTISRKAAGNDTTDVTESQPEEIIPVTDSLPPPESKKEIDDYKYVLQVSKKQTAIKRYNQLKTNLWDVKLETNDSVNYKLYLLLPAMNADTTHVLDSLMAMTGKRVYIEYPN